MTVGRQNDSGVTFYTNTRNIRNHSVSLHTTVAFRILSSVTYLFPIIGPYPFSHTAARPSSE